MAIKKSEDLIPEAAFGKKLLELGKNISCLGPASIAKALYMNDKCFKLLNPGKRNVKYEVNRDKDISTIARRVQEHFTYENAYDVPGNYMMAYSVLFDCSMDYLYGKVDEPCPNVQVLDISEKTGLSVEAVKRLMSNEEICMEDYLQAINNYGLWDGSDMGEYDPELDDYFVNTYASVTKFWSDLIESEMFMLLPENWYRMACGLYTSKAIKMVAEYAQQEWDELPSLNSFLSWVKNWECFHPTEPLVKIYDSTWEEIYVKDPNYIKQVYREIRYNHLYSSIDRAEDYETAYWGCTGRFDRNTLDFFHKKAENWCVSGPFPNFWKTE